ncbi:MAG: hypothetical protein JWM57_2456, partial [Phycisphaerales bacterium]|nr:hypothetical protein [Phycisphaerales bacterium]
MPPPNQCRGALAFGIFAILCVVGAPALAAEWSARNTRGGLKGIVELPGGALLSARWERGKDRSRILTVRSEDRGKTWADDAVVRTAPAGTDAGDGNLIRRPDGTLLICYRYNRHPAGEAATFSIRVSESTDGGKSWQDHSIVAQSAADKPRGLWAPFLFQTRQGEVLCFFDDEQSPQQAGLDRHQWVSVRRWEVGKRAWSESVTVCRANDPKQLSRDGMATAVELPDGRLLVTAESVRREQPHTNVVRSVTSADGGRTWDWQDHEPPIVFAPAAVDHMAVSPWVIGLRSVELACFFSSDEDQSRTSRPGDSQAKFNADLKMTL